MLKATNLMKPQTMAASSEQSAANRKSHVQDVDQNQKYAKTDINYIISPQTSSYEIPNVKEIEAPPRDELTEEVARALLSLQSAANPSAGKDETSITKANQSIPGFYSGPPLVSSAPHWKKSRHARSFGGKYGDVRKPNDTDWVVPQTKQDGHGRVYYWSGKMKGKRKVWKRSYPTWLAWPPRNWLEEEAREDMEERSRPEHESLSKGNTAVRDNRTKIEYGNSKKVWTSALALETQATL